MTKQENKTTLIPTPFSIEKLEERQMLSVNWGNFPRAIRLDAANAAYPSVNGSGESIAVIDTGVDSNHPVLRGKVISGWNFINNNSNTGITPGWEPHGTGTAGVIAASGYYFNGAYNQGIAPGVKIISLKQNTDGGVRAAFDWVIANKYKYNIVGVSLVDYFGSGPYRSSFSGQMATLAREGVYIAEPAGNRGAGVPIGNPGDDPNCYIAAGATLFDTIPGDAQRSATVDMLAPSEFVTIPYNSPNGAAVETNYAQGSSWAAPQIVATAALIHQINPGFTPQQENQIMQDSGKKIYDGVTHRTYSRLDVYAALTLAYQRSGQAGQVTPPTSAQPPVVSPPPPATFNTSPIQIEAENYTVGAEGATYHDTDPQNIGNVFRTGGVDIGATTDAGGGYAVGWVHAGEWINYTFTVQDAGTYKLDVRTASVGTGGNYHVVVDGQNKTGTMNVVNTGNWQSYSTQTKTGIFLSAGQHTLQLAFETNGQYGYTGNFNWMKFSRTA